MFNFLILLAALLVMGCPGTPPAIAVAALIVYCWAVYDTVRDAAADYVMTEAEAKALGPAAKRNYPNIPVRFCPPPRDDCRGVSDYAKVAECLGCPGPGCIGCRNCDDCGKITDFIGHNG